MTIPFVDSVDLHVVVSMVEPILTPLKGRGNTCIIIVSSVLQWTQSHNGLIELVHDTNMNSDLQFTRIHVHVATWFIVLT